MVSSFGLKYGDERTHREFLRMHPDEHPMAVQLFGHDAEVMRIAAHIVAEAGADAIDLNYGCPVRKGCKPGAGAALLDGPDKGVASAAAVMLARGSLGNPWRFERLLGLRDGDPTHAEIADELRWVIDRAEEHLGVERAGRYLRKFYPWYADTLGLSKAARQTLVTAPTTAHARQALDALTSAATAQIAA